MRFYILTVFSLLILSCGSAQKKMAIEEPLPETINVDGKNLIMQGQGFRIGSKMGFTAKVYKIGFYTDKKYKSAEEILNSPETKHMYLRFTYTITKGQLVEGWQKAYEHSCQKNCKITESSFRQFLDALTGMKIGDIMEITYKKDGVELRNPKGENSKVFISSPDFSYNLLSVYIGPKVLDEKFKQSLLGF
ncbi:MAG: chalcone isomerase family protein [Bdellovibrionaceae bacterium]|nr:chalcone isomerase family protein [Pseudobdellovibrionaceae bacterium]